MVVFTVKLNFTPRAGPIPTAYLPPTNEGFRPSDLWGRKPCFEGRPIRNATKDFWRSDLCRQKSVT